MLASSPIKWTCHHVAGHQDDDGIKVLDRWAKLNIEMDSLVKVYWNDMVDQHQAVNSPIEPEKSPPDWMNKFVSISWAKHSAIVGNGKVGLRKKI